MKNTLNFVLWNVRHGSAMYLKTPGGMHVVIDLGKGRYNHDRYEDWSPLEHLYKKGIRRLALVVLTHPHKDHLEDIGWLDRFYVHRMVYPQHLKHEEWYPNKFYVSSDVDLFDAYHDWTTRDLLCPDTVTLDGVQFQFFVSDLKGRSNLNNHSMVTVVRYLGHALVIPGDNEKASLRQLLKQHEFLEATEGGSILVAPHHGRQSSYLPAFLQHVRPQLTLVSDEPNRKKPHTSAETEYKQYTAGMVVYNQKGIPRTRRVLTTRGDGWIKVSIGQKGMATKLMVKAGNHT